MYFGAGLCGACAIHLDGVAARTRQTQVGEAVAKKYSAVEVLSERGDRAVQKARVAEQAPPSATVVAPAIAAETVKEMKAQRKL